MGLFTKWKVVAPKMIETQSQNFKSIMRLGEDPLSKTSKLVITLPSSQTLVKPNNSIPQDGEIIYFNTYLGSELIALRYIVIAPKDLTSIGLTPISDDAIKIIIALISGQTVSFSENSHPSAYSYSSTAFLECCQAAGFKSIYFDENNLINLLPNTGHTTNINNTTSEKNGCLPFILIAIIAIVIISFFNSKEPSTPSTSNSSNTNTYITDTNTKPQKTLTNSLTTKTIPNSIPTQPFSYSLPSNLPFFTLHDIHVRQCASKKCISMDILPKYATVFTGDGNNVENGWYFIKYRGDFCYPQNHTNQTGCTYWNNNMEVTSWVYSENLATQ